MMSLLPSSGQRYLDRVDPRLRIITALAASVSVALSDRPIVPGVLLVAAAAGVCLSSVGPSGALRRLVPLNLVLLALAATLACTAGGEPVARFGPLVLSRDGLRLGALVALKANAIVLTLVVLFGAMEAGVLGHALAHLRVPSKLVHLLLFTVRYLDVLHRESARLRAAMRVRAFRPRADRHTYRTLGYLIGMILVRGFDRSERVAAAMKCRAFQGVFPLLDHFALGWRDVPFAVAGAGLLAALALLEWL